MWLEQPAMPELATLIRLQALTLSTATDEDRVKLHVLAAVGAAQMGLTELAKVSKAEALRLIDAGDLRGCVPAMDPAERKLYDAIEAAPLKVEQDE